MLIQQKDIYNSQPKEKLLPTRKTPNNELVELEECLVKKIIANPNDKLDYKLMA